MANLDIHTTMGTLMDFDLARKYIRNFKNIEQLFDKESISHVLPRFELRDFAVFEYVPTENQGIINHYNKLGYIQITENPVTHYVTEYAYSKGRQWESRVPKLCIEFIVPDNYQLAESKLLKKLLCAAYPYMNRAEYYNAIQAYHTDEKDIDKNEFYMTFYPNSLKGPDAGHLYVPYKALRDKNPQIIIDRHTSYHKSYYGTHESKKPYLDKALSVLEFDSTKAFFEHVKTGK